MENCRLFVFYNNKLPTLARSVINSCVCPLIDDENKPISAREFLQSLIVKSHDLKVPSFQLPHRSIGLATKLQGTHCL